MSDDKKISSAEVPGKFTEWLLAMGCPEEKVPSVERVAEICRGQYYMVWRSLMEHVDKREIIRHKRMQVFSDDMHRCQQQQRTVLPELSSNLKRDSNSITPEELTLWRQQQDLLEKVEAAKGRVAMTSQDLHQLTNKIAGKLAQRNLARRKLEDTSRRAWLLQQVAQELRTKQDNLRETEAIAHLLCSPDDDDIQGKLDRCLTLLRRTEQQCTLLPASNSTANSTGLSNNGDNDFEEQLAALVKCRGDALCIELYERRAALVSALTCRSIADKNEASPRKGLTPQSVLAHTASLHCTLSLEATKNKLHLKQARNRLADVVSDLSTYLNGDACELLVVQCEQAHSEARISSLQASLDEMTSRQGVFSCAGEWDGRQTDSLTHLHRSIESKRDELKGVIASTLATERKIQMVRECLRAVFTGFHREQAHNEFERYKGIQVEMPQESIAALRHFYDSGRARRPNKMELSLELETSDCSSSEAIDYSNPRFVDELRIYLKNFSLEKNRKLVLESGVKIWIFETTASSLGRLHSAWIAAEAWSAGLVAAPGAGCVRVACCDVAARENLTDVRAGRIRRRTDIDIKPEIEEEEQTIDRIKKRLDHTLSGLQKTSKTLDLGDENLRQWSENGLKKYISPNRSVNGMSYKDCELCYLDNFVCN